MSGFSSGSHSLSLSRVHSAPSYGSKREKGCTYTYYITHALSLSPSPSSFSFSMQTHLAHHITCYHIFPLPVRSSE